MKNHLFILGAGRSGTKILRDALGSAGDVSGIPYDVGYIWRYKNENSPHDELKVEDASDEIAHYVACQLEKMAKRCGNGHCGNTILEKSVPNVLRPAFMHAMFPDAKYVRIVRNGYAVIESTMRNWKKPEDTGYFLDKLRYFPMDNYRYALQVGVNRVSSLFQADRVKLWGPTYKNMKLDVNQMPLADVCATQWERCVRICEEQLDAMPQENVLKIRYEELTEGPEVLRKICDFANIDDIESIEKYYHLNFDKARSRQSLASLRPEEKEHIDEIAGSMLRRFEYV